MQNTPHSYPMGRRKRFPLVRSFLFCLFLSIVWYFCSKITTRNRGLTEENSSVPHSTETIITGDRRIEPVSYVVKPGDTFQSILAGFGVPYADAINAYRTLYRAGLSVIFPGDSLILSLENDSSFTALSFLTKLQCWYHLNRDSDALTVDKQPIPTQRRRCVLKGTLTTCLSEDMNKIGVSDALVGRFADIFAWDINFFMDPRTGDRFEILYEEFYREGKFVDYGNILAAVYVNSGKEHRAIGFRDSEGRFQYYNPDGKSLQKQFLKAPLRYNRISSGYTMRRKHPVLGIVRPHQGIDYAAPTGTPVYSSADGTVTFKGKKGDYGKCISIYHGGGFETLYGHLHTMAGGMSKGTKVTQGQFIGTVGSTGLATGPHLDYRMKKDGRFVNPVTLNLPSKKGVAAEEMARFEKVRDVGLEVLVSHRIEGAYVEVDTDTVAPADTPLRYISVLAHAGNESDNDLAESGRENTF